MSEFWALGIEIGGTKLQLGIGKGQGSLLALDRLPVDPSRGAAGILDQIRNAVPRLLAKAKLDRQQIQAVGIGFGGPVDVQHGRIQKSFQITGWEDFPIAGWIGEQLEIPQVVLENDADTAGLAEARFGAGQGHSPLLYVGATEVGHLLVPETTPSGIHLRELEQVASGWGITAAARQLALRQLQKGQGKWAVLARTNGHPEQITAAILADAAHMGDPDALAILDQASSAVSFALIQAVTLLAPQRIVIGGGVSLIGDRLWFDPIRRLVDRDVFGPFRGRFDIVPAGLGEEVVVHGALALARDSTARAG
jgi:glucokinase